MGWYFRKSVKAGPFRINFSKSGVSYSFGVRGARINTSSRGTYVNFGSNGIFYRRRIFAPTPVESPFPVDGNDLDLQEQHTITSGPVEQLTDTDSQDFVQELNEKAAKISFLKWLGVPATLIFLFVLFNYYDDVVEEQVNYGYFVQVRPGHNEVNVRNAADPSGKLLGKASANKQYDLLDSSNGWYRILYEEGYTRDTAFISTHFSYVDSSILSQVAITRMPEQNNGFGTALIIGLSLCLFVCYLLYREDRKRFSMEINYQLDERVNNIHGKFLEYFQEGTASARIWQIIHSQRTYDQKRNAGASSLVNRVSIKGIYQDKKPAPFFKTNVKIPSLQLKGTALYFLPERLLIRKKGKFAAVFYKNLAVEESTTRFIEDGAVPRDALIVDHTWKFINRNGGPDRRFNGNRRLPICSYSDLTFRSNSGVHETISTSKKNAFSRFANLIEAIRQFQKAIELVH